MTIITGLTRCTIARGQVYARTFYHAAPAHDPQQPTPDLTGLEVQFEVFDQGAGQPAQIFPGVISGNTYAISLSSSETSGLAAGIHPLWIRWRDPGDGDEKIDFQSCEVL